MALRILTYACLTYEALILRGEVKPGNKLPLLPPIAGAVRLGSERRGGVADSRGGPGGDDVVHGGREMYERAKELGDQVHRHGVRVDGAVDPIVDCDSGAELFARVRA